jgi:hypothetical protein
VENTVEFFVEKFVEKLRETGEVITTRSWPKVEIIIKKEKKKKEMNAVIFR